MKFSKEKKNLLINAGISFFAIILSSILTYFLTKSSDLEKRYYQANREALTLILKDTLKYSNYSTVNWNDVYKLYYHPYYNCDFKYNHSNLGDPGDEGIEKIKTILCEYYERLQNAKNDFRKLTTEARIIGSNEINQSLNDVENGFDEVFEEIMGNNYYYIVN